MQQLLLAKGIDISAHRARQVTSQLLLASDLILVMESWQQQNIHDMLSATYGRVQCLGRWGGYEIPDPFRGPLAEFTNISLMIEQATKDWLCRILL